MSTISVDYDVLNQRGSPAWFTDTFANIPTAGYVGRMFISKDTFAFYRDTGTGWDLIGGPGIGTLTGSGVVGQVSFFNGTQVLAGNNNLFWDNVNSRLGINTTTPGAPLDIHGTGTQIQINGTGVSNSFIAYQQAGASKWRVGNFFDGTLNTFGIYNVGLVTNALTISSTTNDITINGNVDLGIYGLSANLVSPKQIILKKDTILGGAISIETGSGFAWGGSNDTILLASGASNTLSLRSIVSSVLRTAILDFSTITASSSRTYTLPDTTGTLALTSNLSSYLPLAGGTLTGALVINPTNTLTIGLDVASNTTRFRSDNLEGFKRQLEITMGSGTLVQLTAKGYLANYGTDMAFYTATTGGTNASPGIYITGTNNRVGIKTGTPSYDLDVSGTFGVSGTSILTDNVAIGTTLSSWGTGSSRKAIQFPGGGNIWAQNFSGNNPSMQVYCNVYESSTGAKYVQSTFASGYYQNAGAHNFTTAPSGTADASATLTERLVITNGGSVLVGTTTDNGYKIQINASDGNLMTYNRSAANAAMFIGGITGPNTQLYFQSNGSGGVYLASGGVAWIASSDETLKTDLIPITNALNKISTLRTLIGRYKTDEINKKRPFLIAQDIIKVFPEVVNINEETGILGVSYTETIPFLFAAIKELNEKLIRNNIN